MKFWISVHVVYLFFLFSIDAYENVDPSKCKIDGPGIENSQFHMPVRYFFVTLYGKDGKRLNSSAGEAFLIIDNMDQSSCSIWSKILDRHDGSYLIRYKLFKKCSVLKLAITTPDGEHLAQSPYTLQGPLYPEMCDCPLDPDIWSRGMHCPKRYSQIDEDLSPWLKRSIDFDRVLRSAAIRWASRPGSYSYCHYVIVDNEISRKCYGQHVGFNMFSDAILLSITRKVRLPNVQFLMNLGDWPLESGPDVPYVPMFSWCGSTDTKDIVLPTYDLIESTLEMMGRQSLDVFSAESFANVPWEKKLDKAFWRGRDSNEDRLALVSLSKRYPDVIDAGITRFFFFRDRMHEFGPVVPTVPFDHFFKYKYQISLDGTVAAYRLPYLLAGNGLVLKQESPYYEYFYRDLRPRIHFVPIKRDLSNLVDEIEWAKRNDAEARNISRRARSFIRKRLNPKEIFCYYVTILTEFSKRLDQAPESLPNEDGFERVEQPIEARSCECEHVKDKDSKSMDMARRKFSSKQSFNKDEL